MTWELILYSYSEWSYCSTPRFAGVGLPWFFQLMRKGDANWRS
ncbi:invasion protein [Salmonella enterica]|nr:invasion protein [Salmonella enterica]